MVPSKVTELHGQQIFMKLPNIKYHGNPLVVLKLLHKDKWTDGQTQTHTVRQADIHGKVK
jgi:hypothetical protein